MKIIQSKRTRLFELAVLHEAASILKKRARDRLVFGLRLRAKRE